MNHNEFKWIIYQIIFQSMMKYINLIMVVLISFRLLCPIIIEAETSSEITPTEFYNQTLAIFNEEGLYHNEQPWIDYYDEYQQSPLEFNSFASMMLELTKALRIVGGKHSFIVKKTSHIDKDQPDLFKYPSVETLEDGILHISLPETYNFFTVSNNGTDITTEFNKYTETVLNPIEENRQNIKGIVLDLRNNTGGSHAILFATTNFLFPDGNLLSFYNNKDEKIGGIKIDNTTLSVANNYENTYAIKRLSQLNVPVAVLINEYTSSAAELLAIAIKDATTIDSKLFGKTSAGYTSVLSGYALSNDTDLLLATGYLKSNEGTDYKDTPIVPDIDSKTPLDDALQWLSKTSLD